MEPAAVIAAHLAEWDVPHVEHAIFGTGDAAAIAAAIDGFCRRELGAGVAAALFYESSIGAVCGVRLDGGQRAVVKAHQPERARDELAEVIRLQRHLASRGFPATAVLAGPAPLGRGHAIVEAFVDAGRTEDAHRPEIRAALARSLADMIDILRPLAATARLPLRLLAGAQADLWPVPHSKLFDFHATAAGAEWIDDLARAARRRTRACGDIVVGHIDWRAQHVRLAGGLVVGAFDWDSLCRDHEPALLGSVTHAFTADWSAEADAEAGARPRVQAPTLDEARAFVSEYEAARSRGRFSPAERALVGAAFAYAVAYTARCGHAGGSDERDVPGTFQALAWRERERLLDL